jgi:NTE family protein
MSADSTGASDRRAGYRAEQLRRAVATFFGDAADGESGAAVEGAVQAGLEWVSLTRGERLFRQGDPGDALYIVLNGRLRVLLEGEPPRVLNEVGRGELVGEMAVITGQPRSATVEAARDAELVRLSKASFDALVDAHPRGMMRIVRTLILRLQRQERRADPIGRLTSFAVVPGGADAPLDEFCDRLVAALGALGPTLRLTRGLVEATLGAGAADAPIGGELHSRVVGWLTEREAEHRFLVYQADHEPSAWTSRCVRGADRLLVVADATGRSQLHPVERALAEAAGGILPRQDLVLLQAGAPRGTAAWLAQRAVGAHHHLRAGSTDDFARMVRRLTGQALGLALGGGGARGLAHLGVLRALAEAELAVDAVGGSSVGAMVGALFAVGHSAEEIYAAMTGVSMSVRDPALLVGALLSGHATYAFLRRELGDTQIEDLPLPFVCATANLTRAGVHVHATGDLATAVLASNSAPGIFPPVSYRGELHVDGGLLDNVPVDAVAPLVEEGPVVAVDVVPNTELRATADYPPGTPGYAVVWNRLNPLVPTVPRPGLQEVLSRVIEVAGAHQARGGRLRPSDLYLHPPVEGFSFTESKRTRELVEVGYRHARERIVEWKRSREL